MAHQLFTLPKQTNLDASANILAGAKAEFFLTGTTDHEDTFTTSALSVAHPNPVVADSNGVFPAIYLDPALIYKVTLTTAAGVLLYTQDPTNDQLLSQAVIGAFLYPQTAAELAAAVTPTNYAFPEGYGERYGVTSDGTTDDRAAIMAAFEVYWAGGAAPRIRGRCKVLADGANAWSLLIDDDTVLDGDGELTLIGDGSAYNLIRIDGTNVNIKIRGVDFEGGDATPIAAASDHIGLRVEGSVSRLHVSGLNFQDFNGDGIFFRSDVSGVGARIENCTATNVGRSLVYIAKGERIKVIDCDAHNVGLLPFNVAPTNNTTITRNIDFANCWVYGGGDATSFSTTDRSGFFLGGSTGADPALQCNIRAIDCGAIDFGVDAPGTVPLAMGIETREMTAPIVQGFFASGCRDAGMYSYLTIAAVFKGCTATGNDKGLWMNDCTDFTDEANNCFDNTTYDYDYVGPDGATTFLKAGGFNEVIARGSISFSGGTPSLVEAFNCSGVEDLGVGDTRITFSRQPGLANYSVSATFRGHTGTQGMIESASKTSSTFRILTFTAAGAASDQGVDFEIKGAFGLVNIPAAGI